MEIKRIRNIAIGAALLVVVASISYKIGLNQSLSSVETGGNLDLSLMYKVKSKLESLYLDKDKINNKDMVYGAIEGLVASLDDPYTVFLPPDENKRANEDLDGEFGGVGISLGYKDERLAVMSPVAKTPADRAGVRAGDLILKITDKKKGIDRETDGIALNEAVGLIRGEVGTEVVLSMYRDGKQEPFDVTLVRENIVVPSVELEWKESEGKKVAWIKMYKFTDRLDNEWDSIVTEIQRENKKSNYGGIVLDLRNNPGGYLQTSVEIASEFLKEGVVVKQQSTNGNTQTYEVNKRRGGLVADKMMVLINGGSASAAEILAGAMKEHNRAKLVGEKSFGKGTVQQPEDFSDGSGIHITIAKWLLPSGKNIHKEGVVPDVEIKWEEPKETDSKADNQIEGAIKELLKN